MATKIIRLGVTEGPRLRALRLRALADAPDAFASTYADTAARPPTNWTEQLERLVTFVAVDGASDVGMVRGARDAETAQRLWLISMWVAPEARGTGVSDRLVEALVEWTRREGFEELVLDVADDNAPAVRLYERLGFVRNGIRGTLPAPREHVGEHQRVRLLG